jgi:polyisoprenoid-binding protein YceI
MKITKTKAIPYVIESCLSRLTVRAFASGLLSAFGHNPDIVARDLSGEATFALELVERSSLRFTVKAESLEVVGDMSDRDRGEMERAMLEEVLEVAKYPEIVFTSSTVTGNESRAGGFSVNISGSLSLHGVNRRHSFPARVALSGDMLRGFGEFSLRQSDYNIRPVKAAGGALKLKDELKLTFDIVARRQE